MYIIRLVTKRGRGTALLTLGREYGIMGLRRKPLRINNLQPSQRYDAFRHAPTRYDTIRHAPTRIGNSYTAKG